MKALADFVVSHWYVWLAIALVAGAYWFLNLAADALSLLRGGRGGPGPWKTPRAVKVAGLLSVTLLVASFCLRFLT